METKELLHNYIKERTESLGPYPSIVKKGIDTIAGEVPFKLKLAITLSELITFSSHLRKPIELFDGTLVPTNAIVFALSASGTSKDKSLNALRKSLTTGYEELSEYRKEYAREKAEKLAVLEGEGAEHWQKFYSPPKPLQTGLGTVEGLMHHFADIAENPIGAGSIMTSEIGSELQNNGSITDIIKTISVAYDLGNIPPKIVKSHENQTGEIKNLPVNALFFGSQEALLFNNEIKSKFKMVFNTQLARRSIFTFTPEQPIQLDITSIDELYEMKEKERERVLLAQKTLNELTSHLVENTSRKPLQITDDASKLFDIYLEYNNIVSEEMNNKYQISKLSRKHKQWLALKLAGSYSILNGNEAINEKTYAYAINTVEYLSPNLADFERELVKEPYEQLSDMCRYKAQDGEFFLSLHELRKLSYIVGTGASKSKVEEICVLANSYDENGSYITQEGGIQYKEMVKTNIVGVSYKIFGVDMEGQALKDYMSRNCSEGYEFYETNFNELEILLEENAAYSSFQFIDGIRNKGNLVGGTKFVILDVDKSQITDDEVHTLLNTYNHYVVRTSDPDNEFKYRVILELDSVITVDERTWKYFIQEIATELGLVIDVLPQSQIFLSFKGRTVLSQMEGQPLKTKYLLEQAAIRQQNKPKPTKSLPQTVKTEQLSDPQETFGYAFAAEPGERSVCMYRALAHAIDLGADGDYLRHLADEINGSWMDPMDDARLTRTLLVPALRRIGE
ncbi:MAG: hypothetical protein GY820_21145 [Gammaproteobacteria bacterium]|nr:hypothetical protein [Gammaproteobacteria bacterium]